MRSLRVFAAAALSIAVAFSGGMAVAKDLAPMDPWAGFFAGGHVGYGWANRTGCWDVPSLQAPIPAPISTCQGAPTSPPYPIDFTFNYDQSGMLGGGQAGYNWTKGKLLLGVEASADFGSVSGTLHDPIINISFPDPDPNNPPHEVSLFDMGGVGTWKSIVNLTGKVGVTQDKWLGYLEGGFALANFEFKGNSGCDFSSNTSGVVAGAGFSYKVGQHWSIDFKYDHTWLSAQDNSCFTSTGISVIDNIIGPIPTEIRTDSGIDTVKLGFNYDFGG